MNIYGIMGKNVLTKYVRDLAYCVMRGVRLCWVAACQRRIALKKVRELHQHKRPLRVAFMLYELPFWKNEPLFKAMEADERFIPAFWLTDAPHVSNDEVRQEIRNTCKEYVHKHNFLYYEAASLQELRQQFAPDFLFVVQPYEFVIPFTLNELKGILPIFVPYGFSNMATNLVYGGWTLKYFYRFYVESAYIQQEARKYMKNKARNTRVTGLPMADWLLNSKVERTEGRKRIIWAPHWTVRNMEGRALNVSTFLLIADDMLKIAQKYAEQVELVFKPHPILKRSLYNDEEWGQERTDAYYQAWVEGSNTSLVDGDYAELFGRSDAMIHDCGSFILEYLLMDKPCLYMERVDSRPEFNESTKQALACYQKGQTAEDVEKFIQLVLAEEDPLAEKRAAFLQSYLCPNNQSPVQNIITDLLNP